MAPIWRACLGGGGRSSMAGAEEEGVAVATLALRQVRKSFGPTQVVHGIDLDVADGEFVVLIGPSGCGKSTILRMVAGLEPVSGGQILIDGAVVNEREPGSRDVAMV